MLRSPLAILLFCSLIPAAAPVALAHHSFAAEFNGEKKIALTGVVTQIDWTNPHVFFHLDVKEGNGKVTSWSLETMPPEALERRGVTRDLFAVGQTLVIEAYAAKDESKPLAQIKSITLPGGRVVVLYIYQPDSDG